MKRIQRIDEALTVLNEGPFPLVSTSIDHLVRGEKILTQVYAVGFDMIEQFFKCNDLLFHTMTSVVDQNINGGNLGF
jgi:hypothetical protein